MSLKYLQNNNIAWIIVNRVFFGQTFIDYQALCQAASRSSQRTLRSFDLSASFKGFQCAFCVERRLLWPFQVLLSSSSQVLASVKLLHMFVEYGNKIRGLPQCKQDKQQCTFPPAAPPLQLSSGAVILSPSDTTKVHPQGTCYCLCFQDAAEVVVHPTFL